MIKLESLPNELLLEIFEYFDSVELIDAFHNLNSRMDNLLFRHFRRYRLNFVNMTDFDFNRVCNQYLSLIVDRVVSVHFTGLHDTSGRIDELLFRGFEFHRFTQLRLLSLRNTYPMKRTNTILSQVNNLAYLTRLEAFLFDMDKFTELKYFLNNVWNLPKLIHFSLSRNTDYHELFETLSVTSLSIKHLTFSLHYITSRDLFTISQHTPNLRHLDAHMIDAPDMEIKHILIQSITKLHIRIDSSRRLTYLLQKMSNLRQLIVFARHFRLDGHEWQQIIADNLIHLEILEFRMGCWFRDQSKKDEEVDELLNTFRTHFWLHEHHWFVRCEWSTRKEIGDMSFYTVPCRHYRIFNGNHLTMCRSTSPDDRVYCSFNSVFSVYLASGVDDDWLKSPFRFPKVTSLTLNLPVHKTVWTVIPTLEHLTALTISKEQDVMKIYLQSLISRAPNLYSLTVDEHLAIKLIKWNINSPSIRQLYFKTLSDGSVFDEAHCVALAASSLGQQCESLVICVKTWSNILDLVKTMPKLRTLTYLYRYDAWFYNRNWSSDNDKLISWFRSHLSPPCDVSGKFGEIRICIRRYSTETTRTISPLTDSVACSPLWKRLRRIKCLSRFWTH